MKKLNTNAGSLFGELERSLSDQQLEQYRQELEVNRKHITKKEPIRIKSIAYTNFSRHASQKGGRIKSLSLEIKQDLHLPIDHS